MKKYTLERNVNGKVEYLHKYKVDENDPSIVDIDFSAMEDGIIVTESYEGIIRMQTDLMKTKGIETKIVVVLDTEFVYAVEELEKDTGKGKDKYLSNASHLGQDDKGKTSEINLVFTENRENARFFESKEEVKELTDILSNHNLQTKIVELDANGVQKWLDEQTKRTRKEKDFTIEFNDRGVTTYPYIMPAEEEKEQSPIGLSENMLRAFVTTYDDAHELETKIRANTGMKGKVVRYSDVLALNRVYHVKVQSGEEVHFLSKHSKREKETDTYELAFTKRAIDFFQTDNFDLAIFYRDMLNKQFGKDSNRTAYVQEVIMNGTTSANDNE